jgi:hypothetical protein
MFCMTEFFELWKNSKQKSSIFFRQTRVLSVDKLDINGRTV